MICSRNNISAFLNSPPPLPTPLTHHHLWLLIFLNFVSHSPRKRSWKLTCGLINQLQTHFDFAVNLFKILYRMVSTIEEPVVFFYSAKLNLGWLSLCLFCRGELGCECDFDVATWSDECEQVQRQSLFKPLQWGRGRGAFFHPCPTGASHSSTVRIQLVKQSFNLNFFYSFFYSGCTRVVDFIEFCFIPRFWFFKGEVKNNILSFIV